MNPPCYGDRKSCVCGLTRKVTTTVDTGSSGLYTRETPANKEDCGDNQRYHDLAKLLSQIDI